VTASGAPTPAARSEWAPAVLVAAGVTVVVALAVQSTVLASATLLRVIPQLVLVVIVSFSYLEGERVGMVTGFTAGLLQDLLLPPPSIVGLTALVYTLIGYGVGTLRDYTARESVWTPVIAVAWASAAAELGYASLAIMLGQPWVSLGFTLQITGLVVLYDVLLTPFVFPLVRKIAGLLHRERVYRW